jgi:YVTN family beta-propeller protein
MIFLPFLGAAVWAQPPAYAVIEKVSGNVGFLDDSGKRSADVKVGTYPHEMVFSPDHRLLYITDNGVLWMTNQGDGGNTISIIDVKSRERVGAIDLGKYRRPHGIDVDPKTGNLVVTVESPDGLLLIDPKGRKILRVYDVKGKAPHMVLVDHKGEFAYAMNSVSHDVSAVHLKTGEVTLIPTGKNPQGAALSRDGKTLYVANSDDESISIIDVAQKKRIALIPTGKQPVRVEIGPDERTLIYAMQNAEAVGFADIAERKQIAEIKLTGQPVSLTMSKDRRTAYSSVQMQDKIFVVSVPDRKIIKVFEIPKDSGPDVVLPLQ